MGYPYFGAKPRSGAIDIIFQDRFIMQSKFQTERLLLNTLTPADHEFILALVGSPEWIRFIGDRNLKNREDALAYIDRILTNPNVEYRVVSLREDKKPIGLVTLIKRDYLDHHDLGFAFLAEFTGRGYAFEAASTVLNTMVTNGEHRRLLATTLPDNHSSIRLLEKLGFQFEKPIRPETEELLLYAYDVA